MCIRDRYDVLSVKIRPTVSPVGEGKNQEKSKHAKVLVCILHVYGEKTPERIVPTFWSVVDVRDIITWFKFGDDRLRDLGSAEGQSLPFPIDFDGRPYNTLTLPCERVITLVDLAEVMTDFSYTNFTVGLSNVQGGPKNGAKIFLAITLVNMDRF